MWNITKEVMKKKLSNHKKCARSRNIKCTLTLEQLTYVFNANKGYCDFTSSKLQLTVEEGESSSNLVTIERLCEFGDYEIGNILLVSHKSNLLKMRLLETKQPWNAKGGVTIDSKEVLDKICKVIYNPVKLEQVQRKYLKFNGETNMKEDKKTMAEDAPEAVQQELTVSADVSLAKGYFQLGELVGAISNFDLTFAQYKSKMNKVKCGLTGNKFTEYEGKTFFWVDKTQSFNNNNIIVTTKRVADALDTFMATSQLSLADLKKLCKVIVNK